jgi:hypothetical protein
MRGEPLHRRLADRHPGPVAVDRELDSAAAHVDHRVELSRVEDVIVLAGDDALEVDRQLRLTEMPARCRRRWL